VRLEDLVRLRRARDLMDRDYAKPLDVPALARVAFRSPGHFSRSFRAAFGETPYSYLMTRRIERAKALLRRGDLTVTEVCFAVGCSSLGTFSSRFTGHCCIWRPLKPASSTRVPERHRRCQDWLL
jgi:transcriptional regulator GlxA family with amidase domain